MSFASRERTQAQNQKTQVRSVLFGAMAILDDFAGTFFISILILMIAFILLAAFYAVAGRV